MISATFLSVTETSKEDYVTLRRVSCIHYSLRFYKNTTDVRALVDLSGKINAMTAAYVLKLGFKVYPTNIGAQKIDSSILKIFEMVLGSLQIEDKLGRAPFFQETFLLTNISIEIVLGMLFLILSNANV